LLFYALCPYLYVAGLVDQIYLAAALVLWFMLGRALFRELGALFAN